MNNVALPVLGKRMQHGNVPLHGESERGEHGPDLGVIVTIKLFDVYAEPRTAILTVPLA